MLAQILPTGVELSKLRRSRFWGGGERLGSHPSWPNSLDRPYLWQWHPLVACSVSAWLKTPRFVHRIRRAKLESTKVVDVDGSYRQRLQQDGNHVSALGIPPKPPLGWENVNEQNYQALNFSKLSSGKWKCPLKSQNLLMSWYIGTLYNYLAEGVGLSSGEGDFQAFRALSRGFTHWTSGRIESIEVNLKNSDYCQVQCIMRPSMKLEHYRVYILLSTIAEPNILLATCECAAG